jgi:4,5-DOPA dioxygenase extradiol
MADKQPTLFISHGAPDFVLTDHIAKRTLSQLGQTLASPKAIIIISAHWTNSPIGITSATSHRMIYDFSGFPEALYQIHYPAIGDPALAIQISQQLEASGFSVNLDQERGLDHGAWIPLMLIYPAAAIPVIQISLPRGSLREAAKLGEALTPFREQGMLIIGSGGSVHNLRAMNREGRTDVWAKKFEYWLQQNVEGNRFDRVINPKQFTPLFDQAHPTPEHFTPLIIAWAAGNKTKPGRRFHQSYMYGNIGMAMYAFG